MLRLILGIKNSVVDNQLVFFQSGIYSIAIPRIRISSPSIHEESDHDLYTFRLEKGGGGWVIPGRPFLKYLTFKK